jgi:hypothetical protein
MGLLVLLIPLLLLYMLPTIVAAGRGLVNAGSIAVINIFLGWTLVGWTVALAMACWGTAAKHPIPENLVWNDKTWEATHSPKPTLPLDKAADRKAVFWHGQESQAIVQQARERGYEVKMSDNWVMFRKDSVDHVCYNAADVQRFAAIADFPYAP